MSQPKKLYLDDIRKPKTKSWDIVRSYDEFVKYISENGVPDEISFDHDLGELDNKTGYDCAKWLCDYCWTNGVPMPLWNVHSANPVGRENITNLLTRFASKYDALI